MMHVLKHSVLVAFFIVLSTLPATANEAVQIVRGPVLGSPTPHSVEIWVQGSVPVEVRIRAVQQDGGVIPVVSDWKELNPKHRLIAKFGLDGLTPDTRYDYLIESRRRTIWEKDDASFKTPPEPDEPTRVTIAAGSGANHWRRPNPKVWSTIAKADPDLFVALGDTPYADGLLWENNDIWKAARSAFHKESNEENRHILRMVEVLYRARAREAMALSYEYFRELYGFGKMARKCFWIATWDDHDGGMDNGDRDNPVLQEALHIFKLFTPNPSFGLADAQGAFWIQRWGDIDLIMLDDQSWRTPTASAVKHPESATLLGDIQFDWLVDQLRKSDAVFKIIACGSPFNNDSRKEDSWVTYHDERNRLMDALAEHKVDGVLLLSGDVHRSEFFSLPWLQDRGGYPLYEMVASPLFNKGRHCGPAVPHREFCAGSTGGELLELFTWIEMDTTAKDPTVSLQVRDVEGEVLLDRRLHASELKWKTTYARTSLPEHLE
ncbi:MAG: alkaline phosphatase family protein [Thermoanaerobaculales bacterium]|nr:alkaline phosphatase family protein [Thermoanaerobaculales bacterium]